MSTGRHAGWFRDHLVGAPGIEVGGEERASRIWRSRHAPRIRRCVLGAGVVLALGCTVAGVALATSPTDVQVSMTATTYRVGGATLHAVGNAVYSGDGALVIERSGGIVHAGGSSTVDGHLWTGRCNVPADGLTETCSLHSGSRTLTARDVWSDGSWQRTYSDGERVQIIATRGIPVPFPIGR